MDPNAARSICYDRARSILMGQDEEDYSDTSAAEESVELAQAFHDLDEWLTKGGFLPSSWERPASEEGRDGAAKRQAALREYQQLLGRVQVFDKRTGWFEHTGTDGKLLSSSQGPVALFTHQGDRAYLQELNIVLPRITAALALLVQLLADGGPQEAALKAARLEEENEALKKKLEAAEKRWKGFLQSVRESAEGDES